MKVSFVVPFVGIMSDTFEETIIIVVGRYKGVVLSFLQLLVLQSLPSVSV